VRKFSDYTWTPESGKKQEQGKEHVSNRQFVDENAGQEELVKPGEEQVADANGNGTAAVAADRDGNETIT
jgi:hypothetical protein